MLKNAPHLVKMLPFIIPGYQWWEKYFYGIGLKIYDWMARKLRVGKTVLLSTQQVKDFMPNLRNKGLKGGVLYFDGQFDDSRLAINIAQTCAEKGGVLINYMKVDSLRKNKEGLISGVCVKDMIHGNEYSLDSKVVINATGVFTDDILEMNSATENSLVKASQGIHLVINKSFFKGDHALMIPSTSDGRVLFALPWHGHLLVGTTDTPMEFHNLEPVALESEISFVLKNLSIYLDRKLTRKDVLSVFAGLRPLVMQTKEKGTKEISRDHKLMTSPSQLITITGGKWTTYRRMAEDTINEAIKIGALEDRNCQTINLKIHGYLNSKKQFSHFDIYGSDARKIKDLATKNPLWNEKLHPEFPNIKAEVIWIVRNEMALTIEDVLGRRLRILFINAKAAIDMAPKVAILMAEELKMDLTWQTQQIQNFISTAQNYLTEPYLPKLNNNFQTPKLKI